MDKKQRIAAALANVLQDLNMPVFKNLNPSQLRDLAIKDQLDSLGMVNLIIGMEEALRQEFGQDIAILGRAEAFSTANMQNAGTLIDYLDTII